MRRIRLSAPPTPYLASFETLWGQLPGKIGKLDMGYSCANQELGLMEPTNTGRQLSSLRQPGPHGTFVRTAPAGLTRMRTGPQGRTCRIALINSPSCWT